MERRARFGVTLPQIKRSWDETRATATLVDALGFDSLWACDHLYGVPLPSLPIFEAWSLLAAVAAITERVQLGTLVTPPFFRNPAVLAKQIATIDHVSNGRTIAGLGSGWFEAEFQGYGCAFPPLRERMRALEESRADPARPVDRGEDDLRGSTLLGQGRRLRAEARAAPADPDRRGRRARADGHRRAPRRHLEQPRRLPARARREDRRAAAALRARSGATSTRSRSRSSAWS